jgi:esterase/lipase superfamily enzyme
MLDLAEAFGRGGRLRKVVWWGLGLVLMLAVAVTAFFVYYHPPMRLMPAPLVFQDTGIDLMGRVDPLVDGSKIDIFYATNRFPVGPRDNRVYAVVPDTRLHLGTAHLRIGEEGTTLTQIYEWSTQAGADERPFVFLDRMEETALLAPAPEAESDAWFASIDAALAQSRVKDVLIYVHGANTTVERGAGQAAMLSHFMGRNAVVVLFAWPTAENFLRYPRDIQNAFGAAPHLAGLIEALAARTEAEHINVMTYSAGGTVGSDGLAQLARDDPKAAARLGEVYHAAPDADFAGFVDDLAAYGPLAGRVTTAANLGDNALRLAGVVNRASRAGRPDLRELTPEAADWLLGAASHLGMDFLHISPETMPDTPASSHTFWYDDPWVSSDLLVTLLFHLTPQERGLRQVTLPTGAVVWEFPANYPEALVALRSRLVAQVQGGTSP